jgi:hypothetical protein
MRRERKEKGWKFFLFSAIAIGWTVIMSCTDKGTNPQATLADLYVTTQVMGWVADVSSDYTPQPASALVQTIDGDAPQYVDAGLVEWFREKMHGGDSASSTSGQYDFISFVHDYGTTSKAKVLFDTIVAHNIFQNPKDTFSDTVHLSQFSTSQAQSKRTQGGIQVYATFGRYYFQLSLMGYADPLTAVPDAEKFLTRYKEVAVQ